MVTSHVQGAEPAFIRPPALPAPYPASFARRAVFASRRRRVPEAVSALYSRQRMPTLRHSSRMLSAASVHVRVPSPLSDGGDLAGPGQQVALRQRDGQRVVGAVGVDVVGVLQAAQGRRIRRIRTSAAGCRSRAAANPSSPTPREAAFSREQQRVFKGELACLARRQGRRRRAKTVLLRPCMPQSAASAIDQHARKLDAAGGVARGKDILPDVRLIHQRRRRGGTCWRKRRTPRGRGASPVRLV